MTIEDKLKEYIETRYGSVADFAKHIGMSRSTAYSILTRGVNKASVSNIITICKALHISADELSEGRITPLDERSSAALEDLVWQFRMRLKAIPEVTLDGEPLTPSEIKDLIDAFELSVLFLVRKRGRA